MLITKQLALGLWVWIGLYALANEFTLSLEITGYPPFTGFFAWTTVFLLLLLNLGLHNKIPRWLGWLTSAVGFGGVAWFLLSLLSGSVPRRDTLWVRPWSSLKIIWPEKVHLQEWMSCFESYIRVNPPVDPERSPPPAELGTTLEHTRELARAAARDWVGPLVEEPPVWWSELLALGLGLGLILILKWILSVPSQDDLDSNKKDVDDFKKDFDDFKRGNAQKEDDFKNWKQLAEKKQLENFAHHQEQVNLLRQEYERTTRVSKEDLAQLKDENAKSFLYLADKQTDEKEAFTKAQNVLDLQLKAFKENLAQVENASRKSFLYLADKQTDEKEAFTKAQNVLDLQLKAFKEEFKKFAKETDETFNDCVGQEDFKRTVKGFAPAVEQQIEKNLALKKYTTQAETKDLNDTVRDAFGEVTIRQNTVSEEMEEHVDRIATINNQLAEHDTKINSISDRFAQYLNKTLFVQSNAKQNKQITGLDNEVTLLRTQSTISIQESQSQFAKIIARLKSLEEKS